MGVGNVYNKPGALDINQTEINNTTTNLATGLGNCQLGISTDRKIISFKDEIGGFYESAYRSALSVNYVPKCKVSATMELEDSLISQNVANTGIGIGVATPGNILEVYKSGVASSRIIVNNPNALGATGIQFNEGATINGWVDYDNLTNLLSIQGHNGGSYAPITLNANGGNVGIGNTSPLYKLVVQKTAADNNPAIMAGGGYSGYPRIQVYGLDNDPHAWMGLGTDMAGSTYEHSIYFPEATHSGKLTIGTYDGTTYLEKVRIQSNGNVGIGVAAPGTTLEVNGTINSKTALNVGVYQIGDTAALSAASGTLLSINSGGFTNVNIGGNVGIGTATPSDLLEVYKSAAATIKIIANNPSATGATRLEFKSGTSYKAYLDYVNADNKLYIANYNDGTYGPVILNRFGGDVGIGTPTPSGRFDVKSSATNTNIIVCRSSADVSQLTVKQDASDNCTLSVHNASATIGWMLNSAGDSYFTGGNFGIGSNTPDTKLYIKEVGSSSTGTMVRLLDDNSGGYDYVFLDMQADTLAHGMTALFPSTKTAGFIKSESGTGGMGGIRIVGGSGNVLNAGVKIEAIHPGSTTDATMRFDFAKVSSTSRAAIDATYKGLAISNNGTERACIYGTGKMTLTFASTDTLTFRQQDSGSAGVSLVEANTLLALRANSVTGISIASTGVSIFLHLHLGTLPKSDSGLLDGEAWIDTSAGNTIKLAGTV